MLLSGIQKYASHLPLAVAIHVLDPRQKFRSMNPAHERNPEAGHAGMTEEVPSRTTLAMTLCFGSCEQQDMA
jgi:hypothetical protein